MFIYWFSQLLNLKYYICQPFGNVHLNTGKRIKIVWVLLVPKMMNFHQKKLGLLWFYRVKYGRFESCHPDKINWDFFDYSTCPNYYTDYHSGCGAAW